VTGWPINVEACANCTGTEYAYRGRGYCSRCYYLIRYIEDVDAWDRSRRDTLKHIAKDGVFDPAIGYRNSTQLITDSLTDDEFARYQKRVIRQLRRRLHLLRHREEIRRREIPVSALMLERKFAELLRLVRRSAQYPRNASHLNFHFNDGERRIIYALLEEIIEQAPWRGISLSALWEGLHDPP